jgi:hypothetical protein
MDLWKENFINPLPYLNQRRSNSYEKLSYVRARENHQPTTTQNQK